MGEAPPKHRKMRFPDFIDQLGLHSEPDSGSLRWHVAQRMLDMPLPPQWSQEEGYKGQLYFFSSVTGDTSWTHPQIALFEDILDEVASWPTDVTAEDVYRRSWSYLQKAQASATKALSQWSGPHSIGAGLRQDLAALLADDLDRFFYNSSTNEYSRADPREALEFDLLQQHMLLSYCIHHVGQGNAAPRPADATASSGLRSSEESLASVTCGGGSEDETQGSGPASPRIQVFSPGPARKVQVVLPVPARCHVEKESPQASPRRCLLVPRAGDESVRSQLSFYSALSSCSEEAHGPDDIGGISPVAAVC